MKKLLATLITLTSFSTFAETNCEIIFDKPEDGGMSSTYFKTVNYKKAIKILQSKGYSVSTTDNAINPNFTLKVLASYGYGCATGLTWFDYLLTPAYNYLKFEGPNNLEIISERWFSAPIGVRSIARKHLMRRIKKLPSCKSALSI